MMRLRKKAMLEIIPLSIILILILYSVYWLPYSVLDKFLDTKVLEAKVMAERAESPLWYVDRATGREYPGVVALQDLVPERIPSRVILTNMEIAGRIDVEKGGTVLVNDALYKDLKPIAGISRYGTFNVHQVVSFFNGSKTIITRMHTEVLLTKKERFK
jgi:hypothetical protein